MEGTPPTNLARPLLRQGLVTTVLSLVLLAGTAWLTYTYRYQADWTATSRNTLSEASVRLLERIDEPITITAFARDNPLVRRAIEELIGRYRHASPNVELRFIDPDRSPAETRALGIKADGELAVVIGERREIVRDLSEQAVTSALFRLALSGERWIAFVTGHGERDLLGRANHDMGRFGRVLGERGFSLRPLNLAEAGSVPDNVGLLVVTQPAVAYLPQEAESLRAYVARGGNLLWLLDPAAELPLAGLLTDLGLTVLSGTVVDPTSRYPEVAIVSEAGDHPALREFNLNTLFPLANAFGWRPPPGWRARGVLNTSAQSWLETGPLDAAVRYDQGTEQRGPLSLGVMLQRRLGDTTDTGASDASSRRTEQRVAVIGDGDFLSNAYLGNGGNLDLGLVMINWLSNEDRLVNIPSPAAPDLRFEPGQGGRILIALGAPIGLPVLALLTGWLIWRHRKRRGPSPVAQPELQASTRRDAPDERPAGNGS